MIGGDEDHRLLTDGEIPQPWRADGRLQGGPHELLLRGSRGVVVHLRHEDAGQPLVGDVGGQRGAAVREVETSHRNHCLRTGRRTASRRGEAEDPVAGVVGRAEACEGVTPDGVGIDGRPAARIEPPHGEPIAADLGRVDGHLSGRR